MTEKAGIKTITLAEAIPLQPHLLAKMQELIRLRDEAAVALVAKGETPEAPARSVDELTADLEKVRADYERLSEIVSQANLNHTIAWDGEEITLNRALTRAQHLQKKVKEFKALGGRKKSQRKAGRSMFGEGSDLLEVATYEPAPYREEAEKLERQSRRLSSTIEHKNHEVFIEFDATDYLG